MCIVCQELAMLAVTGIATTSVAACVTARKILKRRKVIVDLANKTDKKASENKEVVG